MAKIINLQDRLKEKEVQKGRIMNVPSFNYLTKKDRNIPQILYYATGGGYIEQLIKDGKLYNETVDQHITKVIKNAKIAMKNNKCKAIDQNFQFVEDYTTIHFSFKLYLQDIVTEKDILVRSLVAYFVDSKTNEFYQFSFGIGPIKLNNSSIKINQFDKNINDKFNKDLYDKFIDLLGRLFINEE